MTKNRKFHVFIDEIKNDKWAIVALVILALIVIGAIFAPLLPYDPDKVNIGIKYASPTLKHPFGTDHLGRDYFTRALYGARVSLIVGLCSMLISSVIGITIGIVSGYFGGVIDFICMRILEIITSIPWMVLVIVISIFLKSGLLSIIILIGLFSWMKIARLIRAETLSLKEREYILYAIASGQSTFKILTKHIIPGVFPLFIVSSSLAIASAIMVESTLSFLGYGITPPNSSWGTMIQASQSTLTVYPYLSIIPGLLIFLTIFSINKIGQVLRIAIDPKVGMEM